MLSFRESRMAELQGGRAEAAGVEQAALFELKEDCRPIPERTAAGRYSEPNLFAFVERER
jgi:hypothetical protein